ncbi:complement C1q tumor necrosis factor-related protein 4-like [Mytilus galloprovincialis]|uniref:complement C1q tumor necrosis factor-related protein 4-like n=1 Tax=Mytilus galloprovincialis TaxID=29158 RepID=UPI003F7C8810
MTLKRILFLLFVIAIMKYGIGHKTNYSAEIPLLDNQNLPLVAQFDTTKLNQVLKIAIKKTIEETMNEMIPRIKQAVLADIGYEPGREKERPAFTASLTRTRNLGGYEVVIFDKIWLNTGGAYDKDTGAFTAPKTGLYSISTTVMSYHAKYLHCFLWKNNERMVLAFGNDLSTGTLNVVMALKMNDKVFVKLTGFTEYIFGEHRSTFSGYLISE